MNRHGTIGLILTMAACGAIATTAWVIRSRGQPRPSIDTIEARARQPEPNANSATIFFEAFRRAGEMPLAGAPDETTGGSTHEAVIRSRPVLVRVARDHSILSGKWGASLRATEPDGEIRVIEALRKAMQVDAVGGTGFFSVTVSAGSASESAHIVSAVADAYLIEDRARRSDAIQPLQTMLQERVKEIEATLRNLDTQRENLQTSRQISGTDQCWSVARMTADAAVKELAAANAALRAPSGDTPANQERVAALANAVEVSRQELIEEGLAQQQVRNFIAERADLLAERARLRAKLSDLNAASMAGTTIRIIEKPSIKLDADEAKGA